MRWFSNHGSAARGEVSILAIIETLIAISISIGIALYFDTTLHILISACIAPFLLLRTEESTKLGLKWFKSCFKKLNSVAGYLLESENSDNLILIPSYLLLAVFYIVLFSPIIAMISVLVKFFATLISLVRNPFASIALIPRNWLRVTLCTDLAAPPEIITGIETSDYNLHHFHFSEFIEEVKSTISERNFFFVAFSLIFVPLVFTAPILYRFSLKATSIIYLPVIWLINPSKSDVDEQTQLELIKDSQLGKIKRVYSWFVVLVLTAVPIALYLYGMQLPLGELQTSVLAEYFAPVKGIESIDSWHISRFLAALLTLVMCYAIADVMLIKLRRHADLPLGNALVLLGLLGKLRLICSLWTIGCGLYLLSLQVEWDNLPNIDWLPSATQTKNTRL